MKIKFHETMYELTSIPNVMPTHFQASFEKGDNTFDAIATDTLNTDKITVYDGEEVKAIYNGYDKRIALYVLDGNESVSVEFENTDIASQIAALTSQVQTQETAIADLGETVNSVSETNETQDNAINDLADAVNELSNTEV